jgi:hypothetical protein
MEQRTFIGGTDTNLLECFLNSFLYEDMSQAENCQAGEIRATVFANIYGSLYVDSGFFTKDGLLQFINDYANDSFFSYNGTSREEYNDMETHQIFSDVIGYFGPQELGLMMYYLSTLEQWHSANVGRSNIDFTVEDVLECIN